MSNPNLYPYYPPTYSVKETNIQVDGWEIPWECLEVYEEQTLGCGEFGEVFMGKLWMYYTRRKLSGRRPSMVSNTTMEYLPVAVKMLRSELIVTTNL